MAEPTKEQPPAEEKMKIIKRKKVSAASSFGMRKEKDYFLENLAMLVSSGMDLLSALTALEVEVKSKPMKKLISIMRADISAGTPLYEAMEETRILPPNMLFLIRLGEDTGRLPENLEVIVRQRDKEKSFRSKLRTAMMYPVMVISLTLVIGIGIAWFILPRLAEIFDQLDLTLPLITRVLIGIGLFLKAHGIIAVPAFFASLALILFFLFGSSKTKFIGQAILFRTPVIKKLIRQIELARFGFVLGSLLEAALPINQALVSLRESTNYRVYKRFFGFLRNNIESGVSLQKSFDEYKHSEKLIPPHFQHMIAAGEESGTLPHTLKRMGEKYEEKVEETTRNLSVLIEPFMLVIVWIGVLMVALAVIMPIYSLVGSIGG